LARDHGLTNSSPVTAEQPVDYLEGGWECLRGPGKGAYAIRAIGNPSACSEPDHHYNRLY
jgi:hypothetical protein